MLLATRSLLIYCLTFQDAEIVSSREVLLGIGSIYLQSNDPTNRATADFDQPPTNHSAAGLFTRVMNDWRGYFMLLLGK